MFFKKAPFLGFFIFIVMAWVIFIRNTCLAWFLFLKKIYENCKERPLDCPKTVDKAATYIKEWVLSLCNGLLGIYSARKTRHSIKWSVTYVDPIELSWHESNACYISTFFIPLTKIKDHRPRWALTGLEEHLRWDVI